MRERVGLTVMVLRCLRPDFLTWRRFFLVNSLPVFALDAGTGASTASAASSMPDSAKIRSTFATVVSLFLAGESTWTD